MFNNSRLTCRTIGLPVYSTDRLQWLISRSTAIDAYHLSVLRGDEHLDFEIAPRAR